MASNRISRLIKILTGAVSEAEDEIYQLEGRLERFLHFWVLVYRYFIRNRCLIRASALSYASLLALIPLLAVAISVTSSLLKQEGEDRIYQAIDRFVGTVVPPSGAANAQDDALANFDFDALEDMTNSVADTNAPVLAAATDGGERAVSVSAQKTAARSIHDFVQKTQSGTLGAVGMLALVLVAIRMLANIEATFNDIWGITRGRSWPWRIVLYWTTITLGPLAIAGAVGLAGSAHLHAVKELFQRMPFFGRLLFDFLPLILLWVIFALVYLLVPNTRVKFSAALVGGIIAGSAWHINNLFGFLYASRVVTNSKIYGGLGLVPVFMVGLYFSWVILLFGAQVAYVFQNRKSYLQQKLVENLNHRGREFVALRLMSCLAHRFQNALPPATVLQLSHELAIPSPLTQSVLRTLTHKRLVMEVAGSELAYVPARPLDTINAYDILNAIRTGNGQELPLLQESALSGIYGEFARIEKAERETAAGISLLALANRLPLSPAPEVVQAELPPPAIKNISELSKASNDAPASGTSQTKPPGEKMAEIPRREVVRPEDTTDFPL